MSPSEVHTYVNSLRYMFSFIEVLIPIQQTLFQIDYICKLTFTLSRYGKFISLRTYIKEKRNV